MLGSATENRTMVAGEVTSSGRPNNTWRVSVSAGGTGGNAFARGSRLSSSSNGDFCFRA